jgi:hypothetical protein
MATEELPEQIPATGPIRFARMAGSSIAGADAAPWITDFLNGAYYRRPVAERDVDDLRLAFSVLTTYWYREAGDRRLRVGDLRAFHRAFGSHRFDTADSARGHLSRDQLLAGASRLLGDWFEEAYHEMPGAAGASPSRRPTSAPPMTPSGGCGSPACRSSRPRARRSRSRSGTPTRP